MANGRQAYPLLPGSGWQTLLMDRGTLPHWLRVALHTAPRTAGAELALTQKPIHHVIYLTTLPNRKQAWGKAWLTLGLTTDGWQSICFLSLGSGLLPPE